MGLTTEFAIEAPTEARASIRRQVLLEAHKNDPTARFLVENGYVFSIEKEGALNVRCPFEAEHTTESAESATRYWPRFTGGFERGHWNCKHAHCEHRTDHDFLDALGLSDTDDLDFAPVSDSPAAETPVTSEAQRYTLQHASAFGQGKPPTWLIKGVLPQAGLAVVFGESGSGKSFFAFDLIAAIVEGLPWRNRRVIKGKVAYVCAEGAGGFRNRVAAYCAEHEVTLDGLGILADAPNFMERKDVLDLLTAIRAFGQVSVIVVDTLAQVMPGANENSGEDVGKALKHCRALHKATGALVLLIHHSGKDSTRGARGWSGLRAAADAEIEIERVEHHRAATITKMKDGEDGDEFGFELRTVVLGQDEDDEPITSCVVEATGTVKVTKKKEVKGANEKLVMRVLSEIVGLGDGTVGEGELIDACVNQMVFDPQTGKRDRRRELVMKALASLRDNYRLTVGDGKISLAEDD